MWTEFWDMHSGGRAKESWEHIYIEAPEDEARVIFYNRFGHNPERVSCTCCGDDYAIYEYGTLEEATEYQRMGGILRDKNVSVEEYETWNDVLVIRANEIPDSERVGDVPEQGYVWVG